ncbi:hypothetical protein LIER_38061 [Lithospermum erythrorhizon]|uniref:Uncharacterized protein n=1 Tax=Lithospermum erythrorhizon TaxID=34254 RepID=A0AAV3PU52_LITER
MASFFTLHGDSGVSLRIDPVPDGELGSRIDWSRYASRSCYCFSSRGNPDPETPRSLWYLKDEVVAGRAAWDGSIKIPGTFGYTLSYWEWAEDVLSRPFMSIGVLLRTLSRPVLASSLSVWDLYKLGGLPVQGQIFDEVVPLAECLSQDLPNKDKIPDSYVGPQTIGAGGGKTPSLAGCPKGIVPPHQPYGYIRASVFKMASCIATGIVSEDRAAHLRQELIELDTHIEALCVQVTSQESLIVSLEDDKTESVLRVASLEEIMKKGQGTLIWEFLSPNFN